MSEVIAIVNEILLIKYLLNNKYFYKRRKVFLNYFLDHFATTLFRQTMFAEFEKEIHDKIQNHKILNYNDICDIYRDLYIKYYSPVLKITKEIKFEWTRIPHFYRQFYTYKYPLSFSIAIMLVEILQSDNQELKNKYINFLKEDNLSSFNDIFSKYDININSSNSIQYALNMFGNLLNEFANS
ncbi:M3 family metallopeptidase [Clostridium sp. SHJSY1]|uniref:M3 family metallopeptidase n=1 Tax=Clostridium sp. SHJSY1 TaxID=2942483 RepID=UPI0028771469|nr:M3 family metallopeptidase [Clostridium sp. SHJSY1]MDS0527750.1 M3 family metallopeptidase [Clostridium sp. SHJSY1]